MSSNGSVDDSDSSQTAPSFVVSIASGYQHCLSHLKTDARHWRQSIHFYIIDSHSQCSSTHLKIESTPVCIYLQTAISASVVNRSSNKKHSLVTELTVFEYLNHSSQFTFRNSTLKQFVYNF